MFWDGKEGTARLTQRPEESWVLVLAVLPSGEARGQAAFSLGPAFLHLHIDGLFIEHLLCAGHGLYVNRTGSSWPQELTFWWEKQSDSRRHSLRHWGFCSEQRPCLHGAFILVGETDRQTNTKTAVAEVETTMRKHGQTDLVGKEIRGQT